AGLAAFQHDDEPEAEAEGLGGLLALLGLLDGDGEQPLLLAELDLEARVAGALDPLVEEAVEVLAGRRLDRTLEGAGADRVVGVLLEVVAYALPEGVGAELVPQRREHLAALLVEVAVEDVDRLPEAVADDRPAVPPGVLLEVGAGVHVTVPGRLVLGPAVL